MYEENLLEIIRSSTIAKDFPDSSVGKESSCNAGDPGSIPGSERSAGEGHFFPEKQEGLEILIAHFSLETFDWSLIGASSF